MKYSYIRSVLTLVCLYAFSSTSLKPQDVEWALANTKGRGDFHYGYATFYENKKVGAINRQGQLVVPPIFDRIEPFNEYGLAIVVKDAKYGVIDTTGIYVVFPEYEYNSIYFSYYPLLSLRKENETIYRHIRNGRSYESCMHIADDYICAYDCDGETKTKTNIDYYSCESGELVEKSEVSEYVQRPEITEILNRNPYTSTAGISLYFDKQLHKYALIDLNSKKIITKTAYTKPFDFYFIDSHPYWQNDMIVLREGIEKQFKDVVFDAKGNVIFTTQQNENIKSINGDYFLTSKRKSKHKYTNTIYDKNGNCIKTGSNIKTVYDYCNDYGKPHIDNLKDRLLSKNWYVISTYKKGKERIVLFNAKSQKEYPVHYFAISEGWILHRTDEGYGYVNMETEEIIPPQYDIAKIFSDSVAIVTKNDRQYVIDKKGKIILEGNENFKIEAEIFSEGVAGASKKIKDGSVATSRYGYIYNPLQKNKFHYAQSEEKIPAQYIKIWLKEAKELCNKEMYQYAKDYYLYVSTCIPNDIRVLNDYAICLDESGDYDGAVEVFGRALKIEPDNLTIKNNLNIITGNRRKELYAKADEAFDRKDYVAAKEYFYQIHNADPSDMTALTNYGVCLNNLGYYDYAIETYDRVLEVDPTNEFVINARSTSINIKKIIEENQAQAEAEESNEDNSVSEALNSIATLIGVWGGGGNVNAENSYGQQNDSYQNGSGNSNYLSLYQQWERRAQSNYNSLTNLGSRVRDNEGNRSGSTGQSMGSSNYTRMKKALREAQNEMRKIRLQAARTGVSIAQSKWETATVGY